MSQYRSVPLQLPPQYQLEDANQVHPHPSSITPVLFPSQVQLDTPSNALRCPVCEHSFRRTQERDRHVRTHLPYSLFCPFPGCSWRGDRPYTLPAHWTERHPNFGASPDPEDCNLYKPDPLVQSIISGESLVEEMIVIALQMIRIRAQELGRVDILEDEWGRGQRARY
jgi:hypothetical protein